LVQGWEPVSDPEWALALDLEWVLESVQGSDRALVRVLAQQWDQEWVRVSVRVSVRVWDQE
jgi:hypothetical protein